MLQEYIEWINSRLLIRHIAHRVAVGLRQGLERGGSVVRKLQDMASRGILRGACAKQVAGEIISTARGVHAGATEKTGRGGK